VGEGMRALSGDAIIRIGGWHPGYARVLLIEHDDHDAIVVVDGNGDGAELELEYWHRESDGAWSGGSTSGHGPLDSLSSAQSWDAGPFVAACGRVAPATEVTVEYAGAVYGRTANEFGLWGFIHPADSVRRGDLPAVTAFRPPHGDDAA
jgi:hypothetical protein